MPARVFVCVCICVHVCFRAACAFDDVFSPGAKVQMEKIVRLSMCVFFN